MVETTSRHGRWADFTLTKWRPIGLVIALICLPMFVFLPDLPAAILTAAMMAAEWAIIVVDRKARIGLENGRGRRHHH